MKTQLHFHNSVLLWNSTGEGFPKQPIYPSANAEAASQGRAWNRYDKEVEAYKAALQRALSTSIPCENQEEVKYLICWQYHCRVSGGYSLEAFIQIMKEYEELSNIWMTLVEGTTYEFEYSGQIEKVYCSCRKGQSFCFVSCGKEVVARLLPEKPERVMLVDDLPNTKELVKTFIGGIESDGEGNVKSFMHEVPTAPLVDQKEPVKDFAVLSTSKFGSGRYLMGPFSEKDANDVLKGLSSKYDYREIVTIIPKVVAVDKESQEELWSSVNEWVANTWENKGRVTSIEVIKHIRDEFTITRKPKE